MWEYIALPGATSTGVGWSVSRLAKGRADRQGLVQVLALAAGVAVAGLMATGRYPLASSVLLATVVVACAGILGDYFQRARPWCFLAVAVCALVLAFGGAAIESLKLPFTTRFIKLGAFSGGVTVLWVLFTSWAFSRTANLPGSAVVIGGVTSLAFVAICTLQGQITGPDPRVAALALAAACFGQIIGVRPIAGGAQFGSGLAIGFALGVISIIGALKNTAFLVGVLPILVLGIPIVDNTYTAAVALRRGGQRLVVASRQQRLHDLLMAQGIAPRSILILYTGFSVYLCGIAVLLTSLIKLHFLLKSVLLIVLLGIGALGATAVVKLLSRPAGGEDDDFGWTVDVLSVPVSRLTAADVLTRIEEFIAASSPHMIVTSDTSAIVHAQDDPEFMEIMRQADLVTPDGAGIVWAAKLLNLPIAERVAGCDLVESICALAARRGYSVYLLGGREGVAEQAAEALCRRYDGLKVAGTHHGYFSASEEPEIVSRIRHARPDVLFVAFGIPRQEKWIRRHLEQLQVPVCIGVGGSFDVLSGRTTRAPKWMQDCGLEWLYRTVREPRRLPRLIALPRFFLMMLREGLRHKRER